MSRQKKIAAAENELVICRRIVNDMRTDNPLDKLQILWSDFLTRLYRSKNKISSAYADNSSFKGWNGKYFEKIKNEKWIYYLLQARNAEEHGLQELGSEPPRLIVPPGGYAIARKVEDKIEFHVIGMKTITFQPSRVVLSEVKNQGETYQPPFKDPLLETNRSLYDWCDDAIEFYDRYIQEAKSKFPP